MGIISKDENFIRLLAEYEKLVFSICYHITRQYFDAEDLTQETFLAVYKNLDKFDGQNEKAWITRIATNKCLDYIKRAERRNVLTEDVLLETNFEASQNYEASPEEKCLENSLREEFREICLSLKPPYDKIAYQYFYEEKSVSEISEASGVNQKTVQTRIYRARDKLRKLWRREDAVNAYKR